MDENFEFGQASLIVEIDAEDATTGSEREPLGACPVTQESCIIRSVGDIDLPWPLDLYRRTGSPHLLRGIVILHDFTWRTVFRHNRCQFRNGLKLASLAKRDCPDGMTPAILLTIRQNVRHRAIEVGRHRILVVNIERYLDLENPDAAESFFASGVRGRLTELADLQGDDIREWTLTRPERSRDLQNILDSIPTSSSDLPPTRPRDVISALERCNTLDTESAVQTLNLVCDKGVTADALMQKAFEISPPNVVLATVEKMASVDKSELVRKIAELDGETIQKVNGILGIATCHKLLDIWESNKQNDNEEYWQQIFSAHAFVIAQIFSSPIVVIQGKAFVGGKGLDNTGGKIADFLCKNVITENAALVEIKTPVKPLLMASHYRDGVYGPSTELSGATVQVLDQKESLSNECFQLRGRSNFNLEVFNPNCVVIAGNAETLTTSDRLKSFELYRRNLKDVEVITFDELFERIKHLVEVLETGSLQAGLSVIHELPVGALDR